MKKHKITSISLLFFLLISCNRTPDRALIISKLKDASKLATVEYIVTKLVTAKDKNWFAKDAYFFAETEAIIKAGIDFEKLQGNDIKINGDRITITLPPIEIINFSYPSEGFRVIEKYSDQSAIFKWNLISVAMKDDLYRQAEVDIRTNIKNLGIIKSTERNTRVLITKMLQLAGFKEIYVNFTEPEELIPQDKKLLEDLKEFIKTKNILK